MRTTVAIDDNLLTRAKATARERGATLGQLVESALRRELASGETHAPVPLPVFTAGTGPHPGVNLRSNQALVELLDDPADGGSARSGGTSGSGSE